MSLERDFEVELLLKADAAEAGIGSAADGPAPAPGSPGAAPQPFIGQYGSQGEAVLKASASLRASRLGRTWQAGESCDAAGGGSPRRAKPPAATEPAERIVSAGRVSNAAIHVVQSLFASPGVSLLPYQSTVACRFAMHCVHSLC